MVQTTIILISTINIVASLGKECVIVYLRVEYGVKHSFYKLNQYDRTF